jgi:hypothetical protein
MSRSSKELSSSPDEQPSTNIPPFLCLSGDDFTGSVVVRVLDRSALDAESRGCDR